MNTLQPFSRLLSALAFAFVLSSCGGGSGNPGTNPKDAAAQVAGSSTTVTSGTLTLSLVNQGGVAISDRTLSQTTPRFLKVVVRNASGVVAPYVIVKATGDDKLVSLSPASGVLTDTLGVAQIRIAPASVTSDGAVTVSVTAMVDTVTITKDMNLQINPGTIGLGNVVLNPATVQRGQSVNVMASVLLNGTTAPSNSVSVAFSTDCGTVTPASALVDSTGKASAVIQTTNQGNCSVTATAGGKSVTGAYVVNPPPIAGVQFVKATPTMIYQSGSTGVTTSIVQFLVVDTVGGPVSGVAVSAALSNTDGGINFCNSPSTATSGADGIVSFSVCAGTLPTNVQVRAALVSTPTVFTSSNILTVQTGLPTQRAFSLSASQLNFYVGAGFTPDTFDGNSVQLSVYAADRQGNPVPNGTPVTFVSEGGQINSSGLSSCVIKDGGCSVRLIGQNYRPLGSSAIAGQPRPTDPRPGRVTVLAYADGEESFIDKNNNNRYDSGELFEDLGIPYLDKNENLGFDEAYKNLPAAVNTNEGEVTFPIPAAAMGSSGCPTNSNVGLSVANSCNGTWDGLTKVRRSLVVVFSGSEVAPAGGYDNSIPFEKQTQTLYVSTNQIWVRLADHNGNPLPAGSAIDVKVNKSPARPDGECTAELTHGSGQIPSTTEPTMHAVALTKCLGDETVQFKITVTTGAGTKTTGHSVIVQPYRIVQPTGYGATSVPVEKRTQTVFASPNQIDVRLADIYGNRPPPEAIVTVESSSVFCPATIRNATDVSVPTTHIADFAGCSSGTVITFKVSVKAGVPPTEVPTDSTYQVTVP